MALSFNQKKETTRTWTDILFEESEQTLRSRGEKRAKTFRRMYNTVGILFASVFLLYCSLFYVGAFFDAGEVVGISQSKRAQKALDNVATLTPKAKRTIVSPFFDLFRLNRIYMQSGQTIIATYAIPTGSTLTINIRQCKSMPVVEVFKCTFIGEQPTVIDNNTSGFIKFTVSQNGFYYFDVAGVKGPESELKKHVDYRVIWRRGG